MASNAAKDWNYHHCIGREDEKMTRTNGKKKPRAGAKFQSVPMVRSTFEAPGGHNITLTVEFPAKAVLHAIEIVEALKKEQFRPIGEDTAFMRKIPVSA